MPAKPDILKRITLAKTRLFHIEQLDLRFHNGVEVQYERLYSQGKGAVLIVPLLDEQTVLLIKEYAAGVDRYEIALPKGKVEGEEDYLTAANRELMEEVGYAAHKLEHISSMTLAPGYLSHITHIILAQDLYEQKAEGDEPEEIEVIPWRLDQLEALFALPECTEARSIAALYQVRDRLKNVEPK